LKGEVFQEIRYVYGSKENNGIIVKIENMGRRRWISISSACPPPKNKEDHKPPCPFTFNHS